MFKFLLAGTCAVAVLASLPSNGPSLEQVMAMRAKIDCDMQRESVMTEGVTRVFAGLMVHNMVQAAFDLVDLMEKLERFSCQVDQRIR